MNLNYTIRLAYHAVVVMAFGCLLAVAVLDRDQLGVLMSAGGIAIGVMGALDASYHYNALALLKFQHDAERHRAELAEREVAHIKWRLNPDHYRNN